MPTFEKSMEVLSELFGKDFTFVLATASENVVSAIYVSGMSNQWTYQKKWSYLSFSGVMSTNGWDGLYTNQQSYNAFNNKLTAEGLSQSLNNRTWIVLSPPANPN